MQEFEARTAAREKEFEARLAWIDAADAQLGSSSPAMRQLLALVRRVVASVHEVGYAVVPALLDPEQVARLCDGLAPLFEVIRQRFGHRGPEEDGPTFHLHNVLAKTRAVDEVAVMPALRTIVAGVLGPDFILNAGATVMSPDPGCRPQRLHRDDALYPLPARPRLPLVLTAAIALDPFTADNGATRFVPGSSRWPSEQRPDEGQAVPCEMPAGSLLFWDGAVFHGGGANVTAARTRRTVTLNYTRGWLRTQYNQFLSIPRATVLQMSAELQRDLGYAVSERGLGACDNRDPLAYLRELVALGDGSQPALGPEQGD